MYVPVKFHLLGFVDPEFISVAKVYGSKTKNHHINCAFSFVSSANLISFP